ncbi:MAG TPA: hypothetical protein DDW94_04800 [Deltaproteobacteria bacterium]|nr:MAG: hypothetical protein A2Z79_00275 [Deltaproteobacteria bacterium GWA2_55_82]OGQ64933.1 MAG: hypothetical protein A3I81_01595 [Deltaproteobacteria bacterium RIFCSPLOWO2_02_FULL_55_12]OIJ73889.1 MAG: hypothetical protein A2V21_306180 [Deltaproteobacteria bacterium GWC2_55_46]HBG46291.1 hypothetical protein [Deltaproteobacteria bacterium]HCY09879.1 hypothetical protein [Deltaproteobacteria bacterium]
MRILKIMGFVPILLVALLVTGASARDYGKGGGSMMQPMKPAPQTSMIPSQAFPSLGGEARYESGMLGNGEGVYYIGTLSDINVIDNEFVVRTEVPGLLGPQQADVPFKTSADSTISVCFRSALNCESHFAGDTGWDVLRNIEDITPLASSDKRVLIIGNPETNEVLHVQILYGA